MDASDSILTTSDLTSDLYAIIEALMELGNDQEHPGPCSFPSRTQVSASEHGADMKSGDVSTSCAMLLAQSNEQATAQAQLNEQSCKVPFYTSAMSTGSAASATPSSPSLPQRAKALGNGTSKYHDEGEREDDGTVAAGGRVKRKAAQLAQDVQYARVLASHITERGQHRAAGESTLSCAVVAAQSNEQLNKTKTSRVSALSTSTPDSTLGVSTAFPVSVTSSSSRPLKRRVRALGNGTSKYHNEDDSSCRQDNTIAGGRVKRKAAQLAQDVQYARVLASHINRAPAYMGQFVPTFVRQH